MIMLPEEGVGAVDPDSCGEVVIEGSLLSRVPQSTSPKWTPMSNRKLAEHKKEFKASRLCLKVEN